MRAETVAPLLASTLATPRTQASEQAYAHTLYLLRHLKSSWADPTLPDRERPLAPRGGRRDGNRIVKELVRLGVKPEVVLGPSAKRTSGWVCGVREATACRPLICSEIVFAHTTGEDEPSVADGRSRIRLTGT